jgi:hypothetical protein
MSARNRMGRLSQLKSLTISKAWLNKKDYKFLDFDFKVTDIKDEAWRNYTTFTISVYDCNTLILTIDAYESHSSKEKERFNFEIRYFNPQTDNDCYSINHIIAVCSEYTSPDERYKDKGNAEVLKNKFIFRKKESFYSYVKIWERGDIKPGNYNKELSYEFATNEYIGYIKHLFEMKKIPRRKIKKDFQGVINKIVLLSKI